MFSFFRSRRRRKLLTLLFPPAWVAILNQNVGHYSRLSPVEQSRLRDLTFVLVDEKRWESGRGLFVTEEMKVTIAAQASLLLLGLPRHDYFVRVKSVVISPREFEVPDRDEFGDIDYTFPPTVANGQSFARRSVTLSWEHALEEGRDPMCGYNVVIHEFAHQLDDLYGLTNGSPPLSDPSLSKNSHQKGKHFGLSPQRKSLWKGQRTTDSSSRSRR